MARAYETIANDGRRVDGSLFGNRPRVVETVQHIQTGRVDENAPVPRQVLDEGQAELLTQILQNVVREGTGQRAAIPGREVAGKTGTTDNYGDAWFVGYTPELVVAVWVGYPDTLRPMTTEFHGQPVVGGSFPAEIWHEFVNGTRDDGSSFSSPPYLGGSPAWVVRRGGEWQLDNGYCRGARQLVYFSGDGPTKKADCKPNEVAVPLVIGLTAEGAAQRLAAQPLSTNVVYKPAKPGTFPGIVVDQFPRRGGLSAHDDVTVVVSKARYGVLPNFVGSSLEDAGRAAQRLQVNLKARTAPGRVGVVLRQSRKPGVAVAHGLTVTLVVGDGSRKPTR
jgi:hypothetical protein